MNLKYKMMAMQKPLQMLIRYVGCLLLLSISFVIMPFASGMKEDARWLMYISGTIFWLGITGTLFSAVRINYCRKKDGQFQESCLGLIHFFQNRVAKVMDICMFVSFVGFYAAQKYVKELLVIFIFLACFIFFFGMHCMLNGVCYQYIMTRLGECVGHESNEEEQN